MWVTDGGCGALSNNILAASPGHPFWKLLTDSLISYNYNYFFPYITVSYASGQWFETDIWETYHSRLPPDDATRQGYRLMMDERPGGDPWVYFTQERGGTWINWDNRFFLWIGDHLVSLALGVATLVGLVIWTCVRVWGFARRRLKGHPRVATNPKRDV